MSSPVKSLELKLEVAQLSDPGRDPNKQVNEDSCGHAITKFGHLCVLCDGMGGHYGGQEASRRAITTIFEQIDLAPATTSAAALKFAVEVAARRVYELGGPPDNKIRPGSTVVAMLFSDGGVDVAHVGDSRAYVIRSGQIYPLTRDHSMVQAMIDAGFITEEQGIGHPDANKITRALGMKPEVDVELRPEPMELFPGDLLLTASDGLTDLALPKDILGATRQALASGGLEHGCEQLVRMANDRGGHDNITVQLVRVIGTAAQRTRTGATQVGAMQTTVHDAGASPNGQPLAHQQPAPIAATPYPAAVAQRGDAAPHSMSGHQLTHHTPPQPAVDTVLGRGHHETIPMQPAATAHDGTNRNSSAAYSGHPSAHAGAPGHGPQGTLPLANRPQGQQNMAAFRADGVGALGLPPTAARPDMRRPAPTPHDAGGWQRPGGPSAAGVESVPGRSGGRVLFMALAISFIVAVVAIALAWLFFIR